MKRVSLASVVFLVLSFFFVGCESKLSEDEKYSDDRRAAKELLSDMMDRMVYAKDPYTGVCFAYSYLHFNRSKSSVLATVPCEAIPPHLFIRTDAPVSPPASSHP